jgi:hypothetical protein
MKFAPRSQSLQAPFFEKNLVWTSEQFEMRITVCQQGKWAIDLQGFSGGCFGGISA